MPDIVARTNGQELTRYDPQKGLKSIAVAEAAEKHFARAKDPTKLQQAIRAKLEAQSEFVYWWDTKGPGTNHGGNRKEQSRRSGTLKTEDLKRLVHRWRKHLNVSPEGFEATYEAAVSRYIKVLEFDSVVHVSNNSGENEWYTPAKYIEAARTVLGGIDLDPASCEAANTVVRASRIYTRKDDGLKHAWRGRVWMNPPYLTPMIDQFCEKFAHHSERGEINGIALVNNATETGWFQRLASATMCMCFPKGRISFVSPRGESQTGLQGQVFLYTGADTENFSRAFRDYGFIVERTA